MNPPEAIQYYPRNSDKHLSLSESPFCQNSSPEIYISAIVNIRMMSETIAIASVLYMVRWASVRMLRVTWPGEPLRIHIDKSLTMVNHTLCSYLGIKLIETLVDRIYTHIAHCLEIRIPLSIILLGSGG